MLACEVIKERARPDLKRPWSCHARPGQGPVFSSLRLRSWMLQEPQIECREHQDNSDVHYQPLPEPVPEEQDVHADHDGYQREQVWWVRYPHHPQLALGSTILPHSIVCA